MILINSILIILLISCMVGTSNVLACGLVAASSPEGTPVIMDKIKFLLLWNERRGTDSCGYFPNDKGEVTKVKGAVSDTLLPYTELNELNNSMFMGHVRAKTTGTLDKENAHPFKFTIEKKDGKKTKEEWIVGMHNGTLTNWNSLIRYYEYSFHEVNMDSKFIFYHFLRYGKRVFGEIEGPAAIVYTQGDNTLWVWKNNGRTLFRGNYDNNGVKQMYISSIKESLDGIGCTNVQEFKNERLYKIKDGDIVSNVPVKNSPMTTSELEQLMRKESKKEEPKQLPSSTNSKISSTYPKTQYVEEDDDDGEADFHNTIRGSNFKTVDEWNNKTKEEKVKKLESLNSALFDNYGNLIDNKNESLDDEDELTNNFTNITSFKIENKLPSIEAINNSGLKSDQLFIMLRKIGVGLSQLSENMDMLTDEELLEESSALSETIKDWSNNIYEQLINVIKN